MVGWLATFVGIGAGYIAYWLHPSWALAFDAFTIASYIVGLPRLGGASGEGAARCRLPVPCAGRTGTGLAVAWTTKYRTSRRSKPCNRCSLHLQPESRALSLR